MKYKFKPGDMVKIVMSGYGSSGSNIGKIVTIKECGIYDKTAGYRIEEFIEGTNSWRDNTPSGYIYYDGYIGEQSFELASLDPKEPEEFEIFN